MQHRGDIVLAHSIGERYALPIPLWLFAVAGALVVLASFALVLRRSPEPAPGGALDVPDRVPTSPWRPLPGLLSVLLTLFVAVVGIVGTQETAYNVAPLFFWLFVWIAVPLSCGLLGDWTRPVNPFGVVARLGDDAGLRKAVLARKAPLDWTFGWWPAFGLFVLLVLGELVFNLDATKPGFVGGMLVVYLIGSFVMALLFGSAWAAQGEVFGALFNAWGRLGFWRFGAPGRRGFSGGLDVPFEPLGSRVVFVLLLLVSINFDGLLATPQFARFQRTVLGVDSSDDKLFRVGMLLVLVVVALLLFAAFAVWSSREGGRTDGPLPSLAGLLPSLVPIAFGYLIAHYLEYLVTNSQLLQGIVHNPGFGRGYTDFTVDPTPVPSKFYWYVAVVVIVAVHVVAVVLSHRHLEAVAPDRQRGLRSELPWLVAMVLYTVFSLFLIAQPLTSSG